MPKKTIILIAIIFVASFSITFFLLKKNKTVPQSIITNNIPANNNFVGAFNYKAFEDIIKAELFRDPLGLMALKESLGEQKFSGDLLMALMMGGVDKDQKIIFSLANKINNGSYILLQVDDYQRLNDNFKQRLSNYSKVQFKLKEGSSGAYYQEDSIGVILDQQFLLITKSNQEQAKTLWNQVINQHNCYPKNNKQISKLISTSSHIAIWAKKNTKTKTINSLDDMLLEVNFLNGKLSITATLESDIQLLSKHITKTYTPDSSALVFHINTESNKSFAMLFPPVVNDQIDSLAQLFNIKFPAVLEASNGNIDLNIIGEDERKDIIITYEFNDDFHKVKTEKIITTPIVNFVLAIGSENEDLYQQLKDQEVIITNNNEELFANPIGKCYVKRASNELLLMSNKGIGLTKNYVTANSLFVQINVERLIQLFPNKKIRQWNVLKTISCTGNQKNNELSIGIEITSKNHEKNILFDLINITTSNPNQPHN